MQSLSRSGVIVACAALGLIALVLAWPALNCGFLSDDISVLYALVGWEHDGRLYSTIAGQFVGGLESPSNYYRPLAMLGFLVDYKLFGTSALGWHLHTFALHLLNAALVARIAFQLSRDNLAAVFAFALFVFFPLAPEVAVWMSGSYDSCATLGMLIAISAHLRAVGFDRWRWLSLGGFALGLMGKEAAMTLPGLLALASFLATDGTFVERLRRTAREIWPALLLFAGYLGMRVAIFGSALKVYADVSPTDSVNFSQLWQRGLDLLSIPRAAFADAPDLGLLVLVALAASLLLSALSAWRRGVFLRCWCLPVAWTAVSLLALLPHLRGTLPTGEGGRFYYAAMAWFAIALAPAVVGSLRVTRVAWIPLACLPLLLAQRHVLDQWSRAGVAMQALLPALAQTADAMPPEQFALVLVPDALGAVPFARNGPGGIAMPPLQARSLLPQLVPVLPDALPAWPERLRDEGVVAIVKNDPSVLPRLDAVYCFDADRGVIVRSPTVPDWSGSDPAAFMAGWNAFLKTAGCAAR